MSVFTEIFNNLVVASFKQLTELITHFGPKALFSLAVIIAGWIFAVLVKKTASKLLRILGFDVFAEKFGIRKFLERGEIKRRPSSIAGLILFWVILLNSVIAASDIMSIGFTVELIHRTLIYIPRFAAFIIILALGITLGRFADRITYKAALLAKIPFSFLAGKAAGYMIIAIALLISLDYIGMPKAVSLQLSIIFISLIPLIILIGLFTGGRELVANIAAAKYLGREYETGDLISSEAASGEITSMDLFAVTVRDSEGDTVIPNSRFMSMTVKRKTS